MRERVTTTTSTEDKRWKKKLQGKKYQNTRDTEKKKKCVTGLMSGIDRLTNRQTDNNNNITSVVSRAIQEKNTLCRG